MCVWQLPEHLSPLVIYTLHLAIICMIIFMQGVELVIGAVGSVDFVQVYPLSLVDTLVRFGAGSWPDKLDLHNVSLSFSQHHKLYVVGCYAWIYLTL